MTLHHAPNPSEQASAKAIKQLLENAKLQTDTGSLTLPDGLSSFLQDILTRLSNGESLTVFCQDDELTTQHAADILKVSRPYLIGLLEDRKIPYRKVGKHRRIRLSDLLNYQQRDLAERKAMLAELTALWQEIDPY